VLAPSTVQEDADLVYLAFDKADEYRMPVIILADGLLGQMMEPVVLPPEKEDLPEKPWATVGHHHKRAHNVANSLYLQPAELEEVLKERYERYARIEREEQRFEGVMLDDAEYVVVAFGAAARIARSAVVAAREEGIKAGLLRPITLWPFPADGVKQAAEHAKAFLSVEFNMGQMVDDVRLHVAGKAPVEFFGRAGGVIPTPDEVLFALRDQAAGKPVTPGMGVAQSAAGQLVIDPKESV
jgi:2-oxoglutarate ferredoxin oxidoreductase subunit alpha